MSKASGWVFREIEGAGAIVWEMGLRVSGQPPLRTSVAGAAAAAKLLAPIGVWGSERSIVTYKIRPASAGECVTQLTTSERSGNTNALRAVLPRFHPRRPLLELPGPLREFEARMKSEAEKFGDNNPPG